MNKYFLLSNKLVNSTMVKLLTFSTYDFSNSSIKIA